MASKVPSKPRQSPKSAPVRVPGEPAPPTDNMHGEEAERVQLISFTAKLTQTQAAVEAAKVPFDNAKKAHTQVFRLAKAAGFSREELEERLKEMNDPARDMPARIEREARHRKWLGIIVPEQAEMQLADKAPSDAKDEAHWKVMGYRAGLRQMSATPPVECPERHVQAFMKEHERGYLETATANAPKAPKPTAAEKAAADFKADNPEVDVDAAARKLKNSKFMERGAPEAEDDGTRPTLQALREARDLLDAKGETPPADLLMEIAKREAEIEANTNASAGPDDGFAATDEELAAQNPRKALQEAAAGDTSGEEVV